MMRNTSAIRLSITTTGVRTTARNFCIFTNLMTKVSLCCWASFLGKISLKDATTTRKTTADRVSEYGSSMVSVMPIMRRM